ncbi:hypothetical protein Tsubulata_011452 [Turnera subulata]|uniref:Uncharacterized protein n=1 Tax=Turnera subulata TaxID=218843 RepID=A0A9Q0FYV0_9ROSI|nr:hypothetical protein Tsubulata_011452 [Turnera subulata]
MPKSSRHKSSKHSSREYSDSEKDSSSLKERKGKEESGSVRVSKESGSSEKRKFDVKDSGNGDYVEEYSSSSKRRKERGGGGGEDGVSDRWNGGDEDGGGAEVTKRVKEKTGESKSRRRDDSVEKSSGKSEGRHRDSGSRKEGRESERERERERDRERDRDRDRDREKEKERKGGKEGKSERAGDGDEPRASKQVSEKTDLDRRMHFLSVSNRAYRSVAELNSDLLRNVELENHSDRRLRRKRDGSGDGDKYQDDAVDINDGRFSSREDGRPKDEKHKDGRHRDKHHEDVVKENRHRDDKQRDERAARDLVNSRFDEKQARDGKDTSESRQKKSKPHDGDRDRDGDRDFDLGRDRNRDRDRDRDRDRERERDYDRDLDQDQDYGHGNDRDWDWDRNRERDRDRDHDRNRDRDRERDRERERDRDRNIDYDSIDDRGGRYKDSRGKKRSPDERDEYNDAKSKSIKTPYPDMENKSSLNSGRAEADLDRGRSQSRQSHMDNNVSGSRRRASPDTNSHGAGEEYRHSKQDELKYRDAVTEQRSKAISSREAGTLEKTSKYRSINKMDDGYGGELTLERSSSSKASPVGLRDRSPSSSIERRYANRSGARRSLEIEESGRRRSGSIGARDLSAPDDRQGREDKSLLDESIPADSNYYNRSNSNNSGLIPPAFRGRVSSPSFGGSMEDDSRVSSGGRYKRGGEPSLGRGQGNAWRGGTPNWSSPLPNGYMPFQHGPAHGGFQGMMPHFPSPPLFAVRPSMEINHSGIPYHIPDADRFSGHLRPLAWQNMMDGSGPSQLHGWDGNSGVFRDDSHMFGGLEWDHNRHPMAGRGWETSGTDMWKGQNGNANMELPSSSVKDDIPVQPSADDTSASQAGQRSENNHGVQAEIVETKITAASLAKESSKSSKISHEKLPDPPKMPGDNNIGHICQAYLSKLDISTELAGPELYSKCMNLFDIEQSIDEGNVMLVDLKDGARAVPRHSNLLLSSSLFPVTNDSVFQRALEIYKKQRVGSRGLPIVNGGIIDVISKSKEENASGDVDRGEDQMSYDEEMQALPLNLGTEKKELPVVTVEQRSEQLTSTPSLEVVSVDTGSGESGLPDEAPGHDSLEKPGQATDAVLPELVSPGAAPRDCDVPVNNVPQVVSTLDSDGHNLADTSEIKDNNVHCPEEGQGLDDGMCGPLVFSDGSTKASGALMPGSNESESVILTRIHHSPENTH